MFFGVRYSGLDRGHNRLYGATYIVGAPDDPAPFSRVAILSVNAATVRIVANEYANGAGAFSAESLGGPHPVEKYMAIAFDPTGQYDPVCKTNLIPSPMPPDPSEHV